MIYDSFWHSSATHRKLLAALIGADLLFMVLHWLHVHTGLLGSELWSIGRDRGFGEMFQYLKYIAVMLALAQVFRKTRLPVLLLWIGVFGFLLLDDSMRIHERFGLGMVFGLVGGALAFGWAPGPGRSQPAVR